MPVSEVTGDFKGGLTEEKGIEERTDETVAARGRTDGVLGAIAKSRGNERSRVVWGRTSLIPNSTNGKKGVRHVDKHHQI